MVLTAYFVLSPVSEFGLSPSSADFRFCRPGRADLTSADLTPATGARTTRLCRTQASICRPHAVLSLTRFISPCDSLCVPDAAASTASRPASMTMANAPLGDGTADDIDLIWVMREREYFCKGGWTAIH